MTKKKQDMKNMYVLGISCYCRDSSATLLKDGVVVAAAEEERFSRKKHDSSFPSRSIEYCLESQGIRVSELRCIAFHEKPLLRLKRELCQHINMFPASLGTFLATMPSWTGEKLRIRSKVRTELGYKGDIFFVDHHMSHAASAFLLSPFERAAIIIADGAGEWQATTYGTGIGTDIRLERSIDYPSSVSLLYSTITSYLGFSANSSEYKVMGLAAYGSTDRKKNPYIKLMRKIVDVKDDGSFRLDMSYFGFHQFGRMHSKKMERLLGGPARKPESRVTTKHKDIAAALQVLTEEILEKILVHVHKQTGMDSLVMAGDMALNSVFNAKILKRTPFRRIWIQPNASDGGAGMGAAAFAYHRILDNKEKKADWTLAPGQKYNADQKTDISFSLKNLFLGPKFSDAQVREFLDSNKITYFVFEDDKKLAKKTARLIHENKVVGWFQSGMEWGPRALGARSILANPCNPKAKELLNAKVKHRELFRPFAPAVCEDDAQRFFDCDIPIPQPTGHMLMVYPVREEWRKKIPSVTHVDGSARLQTVSKEQNSLFYSIIKEFGRLTGIPILINTSFNIRGEPIVCTPHDAYRCMMGTKIDCMVMGRYLIWRHDNKKDIWDSERYAKD